MKSNLLLNKIQLIQTEYKELLLALLPKLKSCNFPEALDEINLFWRRHINEIQLYLKTWFPGENSYVFTAVTYMDFEDNEHLPFLLMGDKHILDDSLNKYSEIRSKISAGKDAEFLCKQIGITAEDNLKILENLPGKILILPLRLLNQSNEYNSLFEVGEKFFVNLFNGINSLNDYFDKCSSVDDIMRFSREDIGELVLFTEDDDKTLPFEERFKIALENTQYMVDPTKLDSYNFFILVFGSIQQAIDIVASCMEYGCIPFIRYPVALHYVYLLLECIADIDYVKTIRFKMSIAFFVYKLFDKEKFSSVNLKDFINKKSLYNFNEKLFSALKTHDIDDDNFMFDSTREIVISELEKFYNMVLFN